MIYYAIGAYAAAMTLANLSVAAFGPWVSPINAFFLIGLDLALRDWLHVRLKVSQMGALIAATGVLTYVLNPAAGMIAVASTAAFTAAAIVDWTVFAKMGGSWLRRANGSNVAGAAVDSLVFPTVAFGVLMPHIVAMQFVAKVAGGAMWAALLSRRMDMTKALEGK
jgi:queuosine precursor transporter